MRLMIWHQESRIIYGILRIIRIMPFVCVRILKIRVTDVHIQIIWNCVYLSRIISRLCVTE